MVDKNIIVNNPTLKDDSYFIIADSKTQQRDEASNKDQRELFQQTRLGIDCNTPEKAFFIELVGQYSGEFKRKSNTLQDRKFSVEIFCDR